MARLWAFALLAVVAATANITGAAGDQGDKTDKGKDKPFKVEGTISKKDPIDKKLNTNCQIHKYKMVAGATYTIRMTSTDMDSYLQLQDTNGKELAWNDDEDYAKSVFDAKIVFKCDKDGEYKIICSAFPGPIDKKLKLVGKYTLTITQTGPEKSKKPAAHADMYGKPAPEIVAQFALNGDAKKLSALKGKVVVLDFWAIWCTPCLATLPHLRDWSKDYKKDGLEVVGVTTYHEIYGFDKKSGKFTTAADKLKPAAEQDVIKDYAEFHKLNFQQLMLSKDAWDKAREQYRFEGIPTLVLIDRKGAVRIVHEGVLEDEAKT
ncbi:MAG TPA: TlpA disulfide reductase family protein, partial [Gemmataceae bacterium]|nr:TlpA disulfide reductase family protein [Gemmataceae bacterium]